MQSIILLIVFVFIAICSVFSLVNEFKKPKKDGILISIEFLFFIGMILLVKDILIYML
ncbi:hypothetical protein AAIE21_26385 [Paenibacillus sp. 102]|uniref:hypothetical protein n=1 Tax=Paenibacillus sp. 102 TaxID=3120823 RepID=UPI0031BAE991